MAIDDVTTRSLAELISLHGKGAVVTGGANGIGLAIAGRLAEAGGAVLIADIDGKQADYAAHELADRHGARVVGVESDVEVPGEAARIAELAEVELGSLDVWVNNAGIYPASPVLETTDDMFRRVLAVNLDGAFAGAREAARRMLAAGHGGVIVNVTSTASFRSHGPGLSAYVASKHALHGLTKSLAVELAPHGIRVLAVAPTAIDTPGTEAGRVAFQEAAGVDVFEALVNELPLGRVGVPDDIARVVLVAVSDLAAFMTGSTLVVDAGDLVR